VLSWSPLGSRSGIHQLESFKPASRIDLGCARVDAPLDADFLALAARDDDAFAEIRRRFNRLVWASSFGYGLDGHTREDIGQMVWLKLFQHLGTIREPERLAGWLATTTRRECLRLVRARARASIVGSYDDDDKVLADRAAPELDASMIRDETVGLVARALNDLDAECRRLLRLLTTDPPMSYEQIAAMLHAAPGSIGPWRQRCLKKLAMRPELRSAIAGTARPSQGGV
jgi:RNA polymerase sigma factor (sigma-70 family)